MNSWGKHIFTIFVSWTLFVGQALALPNYKGSGRMPEAYTGGKICDEDAAAGSENSCTANTGEQGEDDDAEDSETFLPNPFGNVTYEDSQFTNITNRDGPGRPNRPNHVKTVVEANNEGTNVLEHHGGGPFSIGHWDRIPVVTLDNANQIKNGVINTQAFNEYTGICNPNLLRRREEDPTPARALLECQGNDDDTMTAATCSEDMPVFPESPMEVIKWPVNSSRKCHYEVDCKPGHTSHQQLCRQNTHCEDYDTPSCATLCPLVSARDTCESQTDDEGKTCQDYGDCELKCPPADFSDQAYPEQCTYEGPCLYSYLNVPENTLPIIMACEEDKNCASGFCGPFNPPMEGGGNQGGPNIPAGTKICLPVTKCIKPCRNFGDGVAADEACCRGLERKSIQEILDAGLDTYFADINFSDMAQHGHTNFCFDPLISIPPPPAEILAEVPMVDEQGRPTGGVTGPPCAPKIYEIKEDGSKVTKTQIDEDTGNEVSTQIPDDTIVAEKVWTYNRYLTAVEYLWANYNEANQGFWGRQKFVKDWARVLQKSRLEIERKKLIERDKINRKKQELLDRLNQDVQANAGEGGDAVVLDEVTVVDQAGFQEVLIDEFKSLAEISALKFQLYTALMGLVPVEDTNAIPAQALPPGLTSAELSDSGPYKFFRPIKDIAGWMDHPEKTPGGNDKWTYDNVGTHGWYMYWNWSGPHFSQNICGTYFQKNEVCVKEAWDMTGTHGGARKWVIDPIAPDELRGTGAAAADYSSLDNNEADPEVQAQNEAGGWWTDQNQTNNPGANAGSAIIQILCLACSIGGAVIELFAALGNWDYQPAKYYYWKNNRDGFLEHVKTRFMAYANQPLPGTSSLGIPGIDELMASGKAGTRYVNDMLTRDEIITKLVNSGQDETSVKQLAYAYTDEELRDISQDLVTEIIVMHLAVYGRRGSKPRYRSNQGTILMNVQHMVQYLANYHLQEQLMFNQVATCMENRAKALGQDAVPGSTFVGGTPLAPDTTGLDTGPGGQPAVDTSTSDAADPTITPDINMDFTKSGLTGTMTMGDMNSLNGSGLEGGGLNDGGAARLARANELIRKRRLLSGKDPNKKGDDEKGFEEDLLALSEGSRLKSNLDSYAAASGAGGLGNLSSGSLASLSDGAGGDGSGSGDKDDVFSKMLAEQGKGGNAGAEGSDGKKGVGWGSKGKRDGGYGGYGAGGGNTGMTDDQGKEMLESIKREKYKYKNKDSDTLFRKVSNAYILYGFPRLLRLKKQESHFDN